MRDIVRTGLLFDFYEKLLTDKQRTVLGFYLNENFSLAEISEEINISRQAVHDIIKRTSRKLEDYERKLRLSEKLAKNRNLGKEILESLDDETGMLIADKIEQLVEG